jgi:hypothetical protein
MVLMNLRKDDSDVFDFAKTFKQRYELEKFSIVGVVIPCCDRQRVFWLEPVRVRRVVNEDHVLYFAIEQGHIFYICLV